MARATSGVADKARACITTRDQPAATTSAAPKAPDSPRRRDSLSPMVALAASAMCRRIDRISVLESLDMSGYRNEQMYRAMSIDREVDDPEAPASPVRATPLLPVDLRAMVAALDLTSAAGPRE